MKKAVISKQEILSASRKIAVNHGIKSLNMREIAVSCGVAVGSVYNYFPSKADLISAMTEEIWNDIFKKSQNNISFANFTDYILWIIDCIKAGTSDFPDFFMMHSIGFQSENKEKGHLAMVQYHKYVKNGLITALNNDKGVKPNIFDENFSKEAFVDFIFSSIIEGVSKNKDSNHTLTEIIRRVIY